jgi:hypothetical protein
LTLSYKSQQQKRDDFQKILKGKSFLPLIATFHSGLRSVDFGNSFLDLYRNFVSYNDDVKSVFENELPQLVFKKGRTIAQIVTITRFKAQLDDGDIQNVDIFFSLLQQNALACPFKPAK